MKGYLITYKPKNDGARTSLNHLLFGRLVYRNYRGRKYAYYVQGILDNVRFARIMDSNVFVEHIDKLDLDILNIYGDINIEACEKNEHLLRLLTGREYWYFLAQEKGLLVRERKRKKAD